MLGYSRDTFYRYQKAVAEGGVEALIDAYRRKPNLKKGVDEATENAVTAFALEYPAYGQVRVSNELRKKGIFVSPSGVRSIWLPHGLESMKNGTQYWKHKKISYVVNNYSYLSKSSLISLSVID